MMHEPIRYHQKILTLTGPSGVGKTSIAEKIIEDPDYQMLVSITTRPRRAKTPTASGDLPGEYKNVTKEQFHQMKERDEFLWTIEYAGNEYGTLKASVDEALQDKPLSVMIVTPSGASDIINYAPRGEVVSFYILVSDEKTLRQRMQKRGENPDALERRMETCRTWNAEAQKSRTAYRWIHNDGSLDEAVRQLKSYVEYLKDPS